MYKLSTLDTIIFDLGEVIVDLDAPAVIAEFERLLEGTSHHFEELIVSSPHLFEYETGQTSDLEFLKRVNNLFESDLSMDEFSHAWNMMIKGISAKRLALMRKLMKTHQVLILSNTNALHEGYFDEMVLAITGSRMKDHAHKAYYSHRIGYRKPNAAIYQFVINDQSLIPERALFLDDKEENILAARACGLQAHLVSYPDQIFELLADA